MQKKVYFSFFILCAILSQGILAQFLKEGAEESSELLARQKRVIDRRPGRERPLINGQLPYVANLRRYSVIHCIVTILSHHSAITAARCMAYYSLQNYNVYSGSVYSNLGNVHNVTERKLYGDNPSRAPTFVSGIALITVDPPFTYSSTTSSINMHSGPVLAGMECTVAGWGYRYLTGPPESQYKRRLRSIDVPIINHRECQNIYRGHFPIKDEDVCTYHPLKLCAETDAGAPLVIDNQLVGVHIGGVLRVGTAIPIKPDVFVLLQHSNYRQWIIRNMVH